MNLFLNVLSSLVLCLNQQNVVFSQDLEIIGQHVTPFGQFPTQRLLKPFPPFVKHMCLVSNSSLAWLIIFVIMLGIWLPVQNIFVPCCIQATPLCALMLTNPNLMTSRMLFCLPIQCRNIQIRTVLLSSIPMPASMVLE